MKTFYATTPIYYVNSAPHIGHAYTTLAADILCRYRRMRGERVRLLTGTDEHGSKIEEVAKAAGKNPADYADEVSTKFRDLWKLLDVQYDDFIRTTEPRHTAVVEAVFETLREKGDIYKGKYSGFYCVACETYWTETELDGRRVCLNADCGKPLQKVEEESYFFKLSSYQERLLAHYRDNPGFLQPAQRASEILRFVEGGLKDLSVSRTKVAWGVRVPFDTNHTIYVWFDALLNYISAAGWTPARDTGRGASSIGGDQDTAVVAGKRAGTAAADGASGAAPRFSELWPADIHMVGKEIYRFHAVTWPAMLLALDLPLPKAVFAHGWWTVEGEKMSKSKGNFVDPAEIVREYGSAGVDALRYFLFREMPFGSDGDFSRESLKKRYNAELANDLGNLVSRVVTLVDTKLDGELPKRPRLERPLKSKEVADESRVIYDCMDRLAFSEALTRIWAVVSSLNVHINQAAPWKLPPEEGEKIRFILFDLVWSLRIVAGWLAPFMPHTAALMQSQLGVRRFPTPLTPEEVLAGSKETRIQKGPALFPRR